MTGKMTTHLNYSDFISPTVMSLRPLQSQSTHLLQKTFLSPKFLGTDYGQVKEEVRHLEYILI